MQKQLSIPNVVPGAKLRVIDDSGAVPRWVTLETIPYTPRHINEALIRHNLRSAWVVFCGSDQYWRIGKQLAVRS